MRALFACTLVVGSVVLSGAEDPENSKKNSVFTWKEPIGRSWRNEAIKLPATSGSLDAARRGLQLTDGTRPIPYQILEGENALLALVDVPAESRIQLHFEEQPAKPQQSLRVEEKGDIFLLSNERIEVGIRKSLAPGEGPFAGMRSGSQGPLRGGSTSNLHAGTMEYHARILRAGPVEAAVECKIGTGKHSWTTTFTLRTGDPVVHVSEVFALGPDTSWTFELAADQPAEEIFFRGGTILSGKEKPGFLRTAPLVDPAGGPVFRWVPWVRWWENVRQGKWFGIFSPSGQDLAFIGAHDADLWLQVADDDKELLPLRTVQVEAKDGLATVSLPLEKGQRRWLFGLLPKADCLADLGKNDGFYAPLPQQELIRAEFPLDRIKDNVLTWDHRSTHPKLFVSRESIADLKASPASESLFNLERLLKAPASQHELDQWVAAYWMTSDPRVREQLLVLNDRLLDDAIAYYIEQGHSFSAGYAPHHNYGSVLSAVNLSDTVLSFDDLPPEKRDSILARVAFLGYVLERRDLWWPDAGLAANPNMTSMVASMQASLGSLIPDHPRSAAWVDMGLTELIRQLKEWSDDNGGWLEAPHYAMAAYDPILAAATMAANTGKADFRFDPKIRKVIEWIAKIHTPPDSRFHGHRHIPSIGHTYFNDRTSLFSLLGALWKDHDPKFASEMMWMHEASGKPPTPAIGGFFPAFAGYRSMLAAMGPEPKPPAYGSELFPESGAVMRSGFPGPRETMLYVIAGQNHDHYDYDSGSVTIWGKGSPLAEDFGYYARAPIADHNMVESPLMDGNRMKIDSFADTDRLDFFQGTNKGWTRQIVFIKDPDPMGPNYFVINDVLRVPAPATWRMWFEAAAIEIQGGTAVVQGRDDVEALLTLLRPENISLQTEARTRSSHGMNASMREGQMQRTLQGVIAQADRERGFTTVLFPGIKGSNRPTITGADSARVITVKGQGWTHRIFLSNKAFEWKEGTMSFQGTVGAILEGPEKTVLSLGASGTVVVGKDKHSSESPSQKIVDAP